MFWRSVSVIQTCTEMIAHSIILEHPGKQASTFDLNLPEDQLYQKLYFRVWLQDAREVHNKVQSSAF